MTREKGGGDMSIMGKLYKGRYQENICHLE